METDDISVNGPNFSTLFYLGFSDPFAFTVQLTDTVTGATTIQEFDYSQADTSPRE